ncbi:MAG: hypothetical protein ABSA16_17655 [Thermoguttaceae bacterium]|jgi:hypothetical protein
MHCLCRPNISLAAILLLFFALISGCGDNLPQRVPVSGQVLLDGKPLETGTLSIQSPGQRSSYATLGPGGKFSISTFSENDGLMIGKHPVAVISKENINGKTVKWLIPKKYTDIATSGLEIDVPGPRSDVVINLTWGGGKPFIEKY